MKPPLAERSTLEKIRYAVKHISIEPMLAFYSLGWSISMLAMQNLNLDKACRVNLGFNDTLCSAILAKNETDNYCEVYFTSGGNMSDPVPWKSLLCDTESTVQGEVTSMAIWKTFLQSIIPACLIPFVGTWTDRHRKRKPAMLVPIGGEIVTIFGYILCTYFFYQLPMEVSGVIEAVIPAVTGGWMTMFMGVFSYMGDITSVESRTFRMGVLNLSNSVSATIGIVLSGVLYQLIHYYGVFFLAGVLHVLAFIIGYVVIKEHIPESEPDAATKNSIMLVEDKPSGFLAFLKDFFDLSHVWEMLVVTFKKGEHNHRKRVILLMLVVIVVLGPWQGMY